MAFEDKSFTTEEGEIITVHLYEARASFFVGSIEALPIYTSWKTTSKNSLNLRLTTV